jgi:hypothetical protein
MRCSIEATSFLVNTAALGLIKPAVDPNITLAYTYCTVYSMKKRIKEFKGHASILGRGANMSILTVEEKELLKKATILMEELLEKAE